MKKFVPHSRLRSFNQMVAAVGCSGLLCLTGVADAQAAAFRGAGGGLGTALAETRSSQRVEKTLGRASTLHVGGRR